MTSETAPAIDLLLIRHAESTANAAGVISGGTLPGPGLSRRGRRQAAAAAATLSRCGASLVLSSDARRALQTARVIASVLRVRVRAEPSLRERGLGALEGLPSDRLGSEVASGVWDDPDFRPAGGESIADVHRRVSGFFGGLLAEAPVGPLVVVSHADTLRVAFAVLAGAPPGRVGWAEIPHAAALPARLPGPGRR
jgi:broad specificity phosphatase PhoE